MAYALCRGMPFKKEMIDLEPVVFMRCVEFLWEKGVLMIYGTACKESSKPNEYS